MSLTSLEIKDSNFSRMILSYHSSASGKRKDYVNVCIYYDGCTSGYTLNLTQAIELRDWLSMAIDKMGNSDQIPLGINKHTTETCPIESLPQFSRADVTSAFEKAFNVDFASFLPQNKECASSDEHKREITASLTSHKKCVNCISYTKNIDPRYFTCEFDITSYEPNEGQDPNTFYCSHFEGKT